MLDVFCQAFIVSACFSCRCLKMPDAPGVPHDSHAPVDFGDARRERGFARWSSMGMGFHGISWDFMGFVGGFLWWMGALFKNIDGINM